MACLSESCPATARLLGPNRHKLCQVCIGAEYFAFVILVGLAKIVKVLRSYTARLPWSGTQGLVEAGSYVPEQQAALMLVAYANRCASSLVR